MNDENLIKCKKCGEVLTKGNGCAFFSKGNSIQCNKCGNKYIFKENETVGDRSPLDGNEKDGIFFTC